MANYKFYHVSDTFDFGKYEGMTLGEVLNLNPDYIYWCAWNIAGFSISDEALDEISELFPSFIISSDFRENLKIAESEEEEYAEEDYDNGYYDEEPTYDRYGGSYAQDEMGYSDDDIDTIFDGDPSAYWNID